jgi:hypothetical protein
MRFFPKLEFGHLITLVAVTKWHFQGHGKMYSDATQTAEHSRVKTAQNLQRGKAAL